MHGSNTSFFPVVQISQRREPRLGILLLGIVIGSLYLFGPGAVLNKDLNILTGCQVELEMSDLACSPLGLPHIENVLVLKGKPRVQGRTRGAE